MNDLKKHIEKLIENAGTSADANDAMKFAQAALNAANALCSLAVVEEGPSKPAPDDVEIRRMVDRFLGWKLPTGFAPDAGISFERPTYMTRDAMPTGTNLFSADQAFAMIRYMVDGSP